MLENYEDVKKQIESENEGIVIDLIFNQKDRVDIYNKINSNVKQIINYNKYGPVVYVKTNNGYFVDFGILIGCRHVWTGGYILYRGITFILVEESNTYNII